MRNYTIRYGGLAGTYKIYDSIKEAEENGIKDIKKWGDPNIDIGDYVEADDGYILPCLKKYILKSGKNKSVIRYFHTFPTMARYGYYTKDGTYKVNPLYGAVMIGNRVKLLDHSKHDEIIGASYTPNKAYFVALVAGGMDPVSAAQQVYGMKYTKPPVILAGKLLADKYVRKHLVKEITTIKSNIEDKLSKAKKNNDIKSLENINTIEDFIAIKLAEALVSKPKTIKEAIAQAKLSLDIGKILNVFPTATDTKRSKIGAQDAEFEEVTPPIQ